MGAYVHLQKEHIDLVDRTDKKEKQYLLSLIRSFSCVKSAGFEVV